MRSPAIGLVVLLAACGGTAALDDVPPEVYAGQPTYTRDIRPLLVRYCVECHAEAGVRAAGIALDGYAGAFQHRYEDTCVSVTDDALARFAGKIAFPTLPRGGKAGGVRSTCDGARYSMPPGALTRLSAREQVVLLRWLEIGAPE